MATLPHVVTVQNSLWRLMLTTALGCALLATVLSAFSFIGLQALGAVVTKSTSFEAAPTLWDIVRGTVLLCALTVVWSGPFGLLVGAAAGLVMHRRLGKIRTQRRLFSEAVIFGFFAAIANVLYEALVRWIPPRYVKYYYPPAQLIAMLVACIAISLLAATLLRKRLLSPSSLSTPTISN